MQLQLVIELINLQGDSNLLAQFQTFYYFEKLKQFQVDLAEIDLNSLGVNLKIKIF